MTMIEEGEARREVGCDGNMLKGGDLGKEEAGRKRSWSGGINGRDR
jgi:hypothetical protein